MCEVMRMNIKKIQEIPLNEKTAYLAGVIAGDGHISNAKKSKKDNSLDYRISIEVCEEGFLDTIYKMVTSIIETKSIIKKRCIKGKQDLFSFQFRNKDFHYFLSVDLGIPKGVKSHCVRIPKKIVESVDLHKYFLAGLFDTDGGRRGRGIGFTSASKDLIDNTSALLETIRIKHSKEKWLNKKYKKEYFGIRIPKKEIDKFLKEVPLQNKRKLKEIKILGGCRSGQTGQIS